MDEKKPPAAEGQTAAAPDDAAAKQKMRMRDWEPAQKRRIAIVFLLFFGIAAIILMYFLSVLIQDRTHAEDTWQAHLHDNAAQAELAETLSANATRVLVGTYVENMREINLRDSYFRVEALVWFRWEGDAGLDPAHHFRIYKGAVNHQSVVSESYENGVNYQLVRIDVNVSKNFETRRFPLESHQLRFYVESDIPIQQAVYDADKEGSGINWAMSVTGYQFMRHDVGAVTMLYDSTHGDPRLENSEMNAELVTAVEINRADFGMYFKCFIALAGTLTWTLIALYICTYHRVDPLGMLPGALFGTVSNIMIGANLLPDALQMGLLEFVNIWGMLSILGTTIAVISINRERKKNPGSEFTNYYGRMLFYAMLAITVVGQVALPLASYIF